MMKQLCYCAFTFLCTLSFLPHVLSIQCNEIQYSWPVDTPKFCCNKCPPGEHMVRRPEHTCGPQCEPCKGSWYIDTYNVEMNCKYCDSCIKENMEYVSQCNSTHNAVCRCKAGFRCKDQPCKECVPKPATTKSTLPPPTIANVEHKSECNGTHNGCKDQRCKECMPIPATTTSIPPPSTIALKPGTLTTLRANPKPIGDTVWFLVIIALLSAGLAFVVVANIKPFLSWIRFKHGYFLPIKPTPAPTCSMDEEVSTPVQEVCGKCDQRIDV